MFFGFAAKLKRGSLKVEFQTTLVYFLKVLKLIPSSCIFSHEENLFYIFLQIIESLALTAWKSAFFQ